MTSTVHDLFFTLSQTTPSPPPPSSRYIQGRSRRRQRRQLARQVESSESESDEEDGKANWTLGGEISFAQLSLRQRVERVQSDLDSAVGTLKLGVEELARGEEGHEGAEVWGMLAFALEDWRESASFALRTIISDSPSLSKCTVVGCSHSPSICSAVRGTLSRYHISSSFGTPPYFA